MILLFDRARWSQDNDGFWLSIKVTSPFDARRFATEMKDKQYSAELKEYHNKRSPDANSYFWLLAGKLSAKLRIPADEIYRHYIREIGDNYEVVPIREEAKEQWTKAWQAHGIGWVCEVLDASKIPGYVNMRCFYGSSVYDSAQMARLIDLVVQDCKDQDIETLTPAKLERMKSRWDA